MDLHKDGSVPVAALFGGWQPSRAANPSKGDSPIDLGLLSPALASMSDTQPGPHPAMEAPAPPGPPTAPDSSPLEHRGPELPLMNLVELDGGRVHLNGRYFLLSPPLLRTVMEVVLHAYEAALYEEVLALRSAMLPPDPRERAVQPPHDEGSVVRPMPPVGPAEEPEGAGPEEARYVQQMPARDRGKRKGRMPGVLRDQAGTGPAPSGA